MIRCLVPACCSTCRSRVRNVTVYPPPLVLPRPPRVATPSRPSYRHPEDDGVLYTEISEIVPDALKRGFLALTFPEDHPNPAAPASCFRFQGFKTAHQRAHRLVPSLTNPASTAARRFSRSTVSIALRFTSSTLAM